MAHPQEAATGSDPSQLTLGRLMTLLGDLSDYETDPELQLVELKAGQVLFQQGDDGDSVYVLIAGALGVRQRDEDGTESEIDRLDAGAIVGEMALLSGQNRTATVFAINDAGLIRLTRAKFQALSADEGVREAVDAIVTPRWQRLRLREVLRALFGDLDAAALHALQDRLEWQRFSNGDVVFKQGERSNSLYIVVNGRLRVTVTRVDGDLQTIGEICPGETVGEFALFSDEPRTATVHAVRETNVARMTRATFESLVRVYPALMGTITRIIVQRQQQMWRQGRAKPPSTLALLPANPGLDVMPFAQALADALKPYGASVAVDGQRFDELYGQEGASQLDPGAAGDPAIVAWMGELEAKHATLLYVADHVPSPWTRRCVSQADRVLIIADPQGDPTPGAGEEMYRETEVPVRADLVLWHSAETQLPQGTDAWLRARRVQAHYHVKRDDQAHMGRLARRLTGRAITLVLSGGAARGYAQLGVYRAIMELGIPIDYVAGTSMGAIVAGGIARELSYDEQLELARWSAEYGVSDYTLPFSSLMASEHVTRICQKAFLDLNIEDLWRPFFCVSSNLSRAEPVIHQRGLMWRAVRASMSIPGIFAPVIEEGEVLVDGGVMDNFPIELMIDLSESERVIAVQVNPHSDRKRQYDYDTSLSGWRILYHRLNPFTKPLRSPSLMGTVQRAMVINGLHRSRVQEHRADLLLHPDLKQFDYFDFTAYESLAHAGHEAAFGPLQAWGKQRGII